MINLLESQNINKNLIKDVENFLKDNDVDDKYQSESVTKLNSVHEDIINSQNNNIENQKKSIEEKKNHLKEIFDKNEDRLVDKFFNIITE